MNVKEALSHPPVCVEDVDITLTFAYLEPDQLLRMPHSVQKVQWYKVYGEMSNLRAVSVVAFQSPGGSEWGYKVPTTELCWLPGMLSWQSWTMYSALDKATLNMAEVVSCENVL